MADRRIVIIGALFALCGCSDTSTPKKCSVEISRPVDPWISAATNKTWLCRKDRGRLRGGHSNAKPMTPEARAALVARVQWYYDRRQTAGFPEPFSEALRDLLADHARVVQELKEARYNARILASSWEHDAIPPPEIVKASLAYAVDQR